MKRTIVSFLLVCFLSIAAFSQDDIVSYTKINQPMPDFSVKDLNGNNFKITDQKGKVVLIYFWTTWCPYCQLELKFIEEEIWQKLKSSPDFVLLAIARQETDALITKYRKTNGFTLPMASDESGEIFKLFGNGGVPRSYLLNAEGKIIAQTLGLDIEEIDKRNKLMEKELAKLKKQNKTK